VPKAAGFEGVMGGVRDLISRLIGVVALPRKAQRVLVKGGGKIACAVRNADRWRRVEAGQQRALQQQSDRRQNLSEAVGRSPAARTGS
jgi:hypothetical protein